MGEEKRFILFLILTMAIVLLTKPLFELIFGPPPRPAAAAKKDAQPGPADDAKDDGRDIDRAVRAHEATIHSSKTPAAPPKGC